MNLRYQRLILTKQKRGGVSPYPSLFFFRSCDANMRGTHRTYGTDHRYLPRNRKSYGDPLP